jgi:hypothetical protein
MDWLFDERIRCWSVLTSMPIAEYIELVKKATAERGNLTGQRDVLKTTTAKRIRDRMVNDIIKGAVLPPIVLGAFIDEETFARFPLFDAKSRSNFLPEQADISIIDGMQRTASLIEAVRKEPKVEEQRVRVEFWLTPSVQAMVYRMLVLNTGQVPWTLAKQLSVVYAPLLREIQRNVPGIERIISDEKPGRRVGAAQFSSDDLVELYIAFSSRKTTADSKEALSDEFSKLDFVENIADDKFQHQFYTTLSILTDLDKAFTRYKSDYKGRFGKGRNVFDAQPARIGFVVAAALHVLGRPGLDKPPSERDRLIRGIKEAAVGLVDRLNTSAEEKVGEFLKLDILREILDKKVGQIGRYERAVFFDAFKVLIEEKFNLPDMESCWRAN